jgi:type 1 glutamine amidotransferase
MENDMTTMTAGPLVAHPMTSYKDVTLQISSPVTVPLSPCKFEI